MLMSLLQLLLLRRQIKRIKSDTSNRHSKTIFVKPYYLLTLPGFGPDISAKVMAAVGDPERFVKGRQVLKLAGLDLGADRSGKNSDKAIPEISKRGKADLRQALYQAALVASRRNPEFMRYYRSKIRGREKEQGIHRKMLVKLSAKMLVIAWTLMKKQEAFNPAFIKVE
jgi:transposase